MTEPAPMITKGIIDQDEMSFEIATLSLWKAIIASLWQ